MTTMPRFLAFRRRLGELALVLLIPLTVSLFDTMQLSAQSKAAITVAVGTQALTVPWYTAPVTRRINPALYVGTDSRLKSGTSWRLFFAVNVGIFQNHWWMTGLSVEPEIGVGRTLPGGFYTDLRLGVGYMHYSWRRERLKLEGDHYGTASDWGNPSLVVPLSATFAFRGSSDKPIPVSPFVSARWGVQGLFLPEFPVATHLFLLGGVRIERRRATSTGRA